MSKSDGWKTSNILALSPPLAYCARRASRGFADLSGQRLLRSGFEAECGITSFGWPITWYRCAYGLDVEEWQLHQARLAVNLVAWLLMLAAAFFASEWLFSKYRLRFRWSLRTMLVVVALVAVFCGWLASALRRAGIQDPLIAALGNVVWVERTGPRWLGLFGADRLRQQIVGASLEFSANDDREAVELLQRLSHMPKFRYLFLEVDALTPDVVRAIRNIKGLRALSIERDSYRDGRCLSDECLEVIGNLTQLEHLRLAGFQIKSSSLRHFEQLAHLRSLSLKAMATVDSSLLSDLPALPQLNSLDLGHSETVDADIDWIVLQPRLRSLSLEYTDVTVAGMDRLAPCATLEELTIGGATFTAGALSSLLRLNSLKYLHLDPLIGFEETGVTLDDGSPVEVPEDELDASRRALNTLRLAHPDLIVDGDSPSHGWFPAEVMPRGCEFVAERTENLFPSVPRLDATFWLQPPGKRFFKAIEW